MVKRKSKNPTSPFTPRLRALRKRFDGWPVDALLVSNPRDIRYLTGFVGDDSWLLVKPASGKPLIISDSRFTEQIKREAPQAAMHIRKSKLSDELPAILQRSKVGKLGLQIDHTTLRTHAVLDKALGRVKVKIKPIDDGLLEQRAVKDDQEVAAIRKAIRIQQQAYLQLLDWLKPGVREDQIAAYLEYQMRDLGADGPSFPTIAAIGPNAALPHAIPGRRKLKKGDLLLIDWGAKYKGYCGDLTRVIALGSMPRKMREVYRIVLDAQLAGIAAIRPGAKLADVDQAARTVIEKAGYGKAFGHSLGHGIGLDIHENPTLSGKSPGELMVGHVVTVEPGIYLPGGELPGGGVRIEDDVLVTPRGGRLLSDLPKGLESVII